jgi:hypothetical protein
LEVRAHNCAGSIETVISYAFVVWKSA